MWSQRVRLALLRNTQPLFAERTGMGRFFDSLSVQRRTFLKLGGAGAAMLVSPALAAGKAAPPSLPTPEDLASVEMEFGFTDLFQMPVFANEWGYGQTSKSVSGVTGITFPPFACCGVPDVTWSPGLLTSCEIQMVAPASGSRANVQRSAISYADLHACEAARSRAAHRGNEHRVHGTQLCVVLRHARGGDEEDDFLDGWLSR